MVIFGVVVVEKEGGASKSSATPSGQTPPARSNLKKNAKLKGVVNATAHLTTYGSDSDCNTTSGTP